MILRLHKDEAAVLEPYVLDDAYYAVPYRQDFWLLYYNKGLFDAAYSDVGRPGVPPERLLKALLLMALYSVRSERQLVERVEREYRARDSERLNLQTASGDLWSGRERMFGVDRPLPDEAEHEPSYRAEGRPSAEAPG